MNATVGGLFDGCGLLAYGLHLAGWEHRWLCEVDPWRRELLALRWPGVRIYDDVRAVDARAERPLLIAGGFPCKGGSTAGLRNGFDHPETVLWREMARAIRELRPRYVLVENVANLLAISDGAVWDEVLGNLGACGYDTVWDCIPAAAFGAPHLRDRVIAIAANTDGAIERWARGDGEGPNRWHDAGRASAGAPADPQCDSVRQQPEPIGGRCGTSELGGRSSSVADPCRAGWQERDSTLAGTASLAGPPNDPASTQDADSRTAQPARSQWRREPEGTGRPVAVEWGEYEPAIRRWERSLGRPAGEPLLQGVVARGARRLVRSRLSALGDGVQVQLGQLAGEYILGRERERLAA